MSDDKVVKLGAKREKHKHEETYDDKNEQELVYCSFCKRPNTQVLKMTGSQHMLRVRNDCRTVFNS